MNFRNWIEHKWFEFKDTVELFHGTSSALLPVIQKNGLEPPEESLEAYALRILKLYNVSPTPELMEWIHKYAISSRANTPKHTIGNAVYLANTFNDARGYANYTHKFGGEMAADIWRAINVIESKKRGLSQMEELIPPIYKESRPVVLVVEIPHEWMKTYYDLEEKYKDALKYFDAWKFQYTSLHDYLSKEISHFEIRVDQTIPASMIKEIHELNSTPNALSSKYL